MNLDGVIDAKRHASTGNRNNNLTVNHICDIIKEKVNVSRFEKKIVDWIRIDDLPNHPLDIETIRTQPANKIDGTFFEVREGDILVARLGPTILNQKIVMVRSLERPTIASAEFLVLRCKPGYEPEAVMAIFKTGYYRDLMYSHARGWYYFRTLERAGEDMVSLGGYARNGNQDLVLSLSTKAKKCCEICGRGHCSEQRSAGLF